MYMFPKGNADFEEIRRDGFVYVDKTNYIELLEKSGNKSMHFLRPRRFGKSLFTSMLECYYDVNKANKFDELFKGTYIYEQPTTKHNKYYVLSFDFSGMGGKKGKELENTFDEKVYVSAKEFCKKYGLECTIPTGLSAALTMFTMFSGIREQLNDRRVYTIIDEYDHFANDLLSFDFNEFTSATRSDGFIRAFYEELKAATKGVVAQIFITGVSPITLDSMTSGFNISTNLSLDPRFNEMMGFTTEEIKYLISLVDSIEKPDDTLLKMKEYYDGYKFAKKGKEHVFNPNMALYYIDQLQNNAEEPESLIDPNIYTDDERSNNLLEIHPDPSQQQVIADILSDQILKCKLTSTFEINAKFTRDDFISLLYYMGYLTICGSIGARVLLKVPNEVIKNVYFDHFRRMIKRDDAIILNKDMDAIDNILYNKDNTLFIEQVESCLEILDNRDYMKFDEGRLKVVCASISKANPSVLFKSEYPVANGFVDIVLFPYRVEGATALIELKYIKVKDFTETLLQEKRQTALEELRKYESAKEFLGKDIVKWVLIFSKDKCVLNETVA